jgi:PBP1b-binding outer membrane lipoprotein LpoB
MKKKLTLLLLLIISIFAFTGCSAPDGHVSDSDNGGSGTTE